MKQAEAPDTSVKEKPLRKLQALAQSIWRDTTSTSGPWRSREMASWQFTRQGGELAEFAKKARGQVAIVSAKGAYQIYREILAAIGS